MPINWILRHKPQQELRSSFKVWQPTELWALLMIYNFVAQLWAIFFMAILHEIKRVFIDEMPNFHHRL